MHPTRRLTRPALAITTALATVAVTGALAVMVTAAPSTAAACNGYVGLTFDDGPTPSNTQNLLNALRANGLRATMFNEGRKVQQYPSLVQAQAAAGMWIGNHSWSHPHMTQLSTAQMTSEISQTQQIIQQVTGTAPKLFRPPYGETNSTLRSIQAQYGLTEVIWDVDSQDYNNVSTAQIVQAVGRLNNGQVILMHDWPANTLAAIPQIAANLASRNLCAGMISPTTGRAVAPDGGNPTTSPTTAPATTRPPTAAPTDPPGSASRIVGQQSGRCVDVPNSSRNNGTRVQLYDCHGQSNQAWTYNTSNRQLRVYGDMCLDTAGSGNGSAVQIYSCHSGTNQQWNVNSNGTISGVQSGRCLDAWSTANGAQIQLYDCHSGANQRFSLVSLNR